MYQRAGALLTVSARKQKGNPPARCRRPAGASSPDLLRKQKLNERCPIGLFNQRIQQVRGIFAQSSRVESHRRGQCFCDTILRGGQSFIAGILESRRALLVRKLGQNFLESPTPSRVGAKPSKIMISQGWCVFNRYCTPKKTPRGKYFRDVFLNLSPEDAPDPFKKSLPPKRATNTAAEAPSSQKPHRPNIVL